MIAVRDWVDLFKQGLLIYKLLLRRRLLLFCNL